MSYWVFPQQMYTRICMVPFLENSIQEIYTDNHAYKVNELSDTCSVCYIYVTRNRVVCYIQGCAFLDACIFSQGESPSIMVNPITVLKKRNTLYMLYLHVTSQSVTFYYILDRDSFMDVVYVQYMLTQERYGRYTNRSVVCNT